MMWAIPPEVAGREPSATPEQLEGGGITESMPIQYVRPDSTPESVTVTKGGGDFPFNIKSKS